MLSLLGSQASSSDTGTVVACIQQAGLIYSEDEGVTWYASNITTGTYRIVRHKGNFIAVNGSGTTLSTSYYSEYGKVWTASNTLVTAGGGLATNGTIVMAVGGTNTHTSEDGSTWTAKSTATYNGRKLVYGDGKFVTILTSTGGTYGGSYTTNNGTSWTNFNNIYPYGYLDIIYDTVRSRFVLFREGAYAVYTTDFSTFSNLGSTPNNLNYVDKLDDVILGEIGRA
ncbi:MAG: hypothetical protein HGA35_01245, partial [Erysipelotrichaceae bacterium]|nr:hypothetical protein [Erysipelotrichaceae bacterium]